MGDRVWIGIAIAVAAAGVAGYLLLDGLAAGLSLFAAGLVLVAFGVSGWWDER